jgi:hypothetical protein
MPIVNWFSVISRHPDYIVHTILCEKGPQSAAQTSHLHGDDKKVGGVAGREIGVTFNRTHAS